MGTFNIIIVYFENIYFENFKFNKKKMIHQSFAQAFMLKT